MISAFHRGIILPLLAVAAFGFAAESPNLSHVTPITVAILDFEANFPGSPQLGQDISDVLTATLSGEPGFALVERPTLRRALEEQALNLSGLADSETATRVGKLVGAKLLISGRAFRLDDHLLLTAKLIGTETGLVDSVLIKDPGTGDIGSMALQLGERLSQRLREKGPHLIAHDQEGTDPLPALKEQWSHRLPVKIAVIVREEHYAALQTRPIDPAVETEIKRLLRECGITIQDVPVNDLADWIQKGQFHDVQAWPTTLADVDYIITGKAFSEAAPVIVNLHTCLARAEINIIKRTSGEIVVADRANGRAVDLGEHIAAKKALESVGRSLGLRLLDRLGALTSAKP